MFREVSPNVRSSDAYVPKPSDILRKWRGQLGRTIDSCALMYGRAYVPRFSSRRRGLLVKVEGAVGMKIGKTALKGSCKNVGGE